MNNKIKENITSSQMVAILFSGMVGSEILFIPQYMVKNAAQDAWIYTALGAIYPLYIVIVILIYIRYYPNDNILSLSKRFFGKVAGSFCNLIFLVQFIVYTAIRCCHLSNLIRVYIVFFLNPQTVISIAILAVAYMCYKGIGTFSRANEIFFYLTLPIILVPIGALRYGNILNIMPVFQGDIYSVPANIINGIYNYFGIEIALLIYPLIKNKKKIKIVGFISVSLVCLMFTWVTFISIYYLGIDIIPKYLWPVITTVKALNLRAIRNFTYIFLYFWVIVALKSIATNYYASALVMNDLIKKVSISSFCVYLMPFIYYISFKLGNETMSRSIMDRILPFLVNFNIIFTSIIVILVIIKKGKK